MVLLCFFVTFFRRIWELIFFKGEFRNISRERYSLGPVEIGAWCRPPALFAAMFSELATKETIFQPCSYPPAAHRVMTHSKALILSKLFHTAQTGNQQKVCKVKHNLRLHPHWDLFNCIVYCLLYIFVSKCLYSDIQYLMIFLHSTFDVLKIHMKRKFCFHDVVSDFGVWSFHDGGNERNMLSISCSEFGAWCFWIGEKLLKLSLSVCQLLLFGIVLTALTSRQSQNTSVNDFSRCW